MPLADSITTSQRRDLEAAFLTAGTGAVAIGLAALLLHGNTALPQRFTPRVVRPDATFRRQGPGRHISQHEDFEWTTIEGRRAVTVPYALVQALPEVGRFTLIGLLDSAVHQGKLTDLTRLCALAGKHRGVRLLRTCVPSVDGRSESFLETLARVQCTDAGLPPDEVQLEFRDPYGNVIARVDLAWRLPGGRWLVVELDGVSTHGVVEAAYADRARTNQLVARGDITMLRFTARDLARVGYVPATIRSALARLAA